MFYLFQVISVFRKIETLNETVAYFTKLPKAY